MIACYIRRFRRYSLMFSRDYVPSLLQFTSIDKSLWITTYTYRSYCHPQLLLLLQDVLKYSSLFREFLRLLPCSSLLHEYPYGKLLVLAEYPLIPSCSCVSQKSSKIIFDLPKILWSLWLLKFLLACIMVNPITLVVLLTFLVIIIFESVDSICLRIHAIIFDPYKLLFRLSCHSFNWNWFSTNPIVVDCTIRLFNLSIPNQSIASDPLIWKS